MESKRYNDNDLITMSTADFNAACKRREGAGYQRGIRKAAEVARRVQQEFLDPDYAVPQPMGSVRERFACSEVITAIEARSQETDNG